MSGGLVLEAIYNGNTQLNGIIRYVAKKKHTEVGKVSKNVEQVLAALVELDHVRRIQKRKNGIIMYLITKRGRKAFEDERQPKAEQTQPGI